MGVAIHVLGAIEVVRGEERTRLRRPQVRQIVGLLAAEAGQWIGADALQDELWPADQPRVPRAALHVVMNRVRETLGEERAALESEGDRYRLMLEPDGIDAAVWERNVAESGRSRAQGEPERALELLTAARQLWRGRPFDDIDRSFRLDRERERLETARIDAELDEIELLLVIGDRGSAARLAETLVGRCVLREDVVIRAMDALHQAGRAADGLRVAAQFRSDLREQLGASPSSALDAAEVTLLSHDKGTEPAGGGTEPSFLAAVGPRPSTDPTAAVADSRQLVIPADAKGAREAADEALRRRAYPDAADLYAAAAASSASTPEQLDARLREAEARELAGERSRASAIYEDMTAAVVDSGDTDLLVRVALGGSGHASAIGGRYDRRSRLRLAWRRLAADDERRDTLAAELALELVSSRQAPPADVELHVRRVAHDPKSPGYIAARRYVVAMAEMDVGAGVDSARRLAAECAAMVVTSAHQSAALAVAIMAGLSAGAWVDVEGWIDEMRLLGHRSDEPRARWQSLAFLATLHEARGDSIAADEAAAEALREGTRLEMGDAFATYSLHFLGRAYRDGSLAPFAGPIASVAERYRFPVWSILRGLAELDHGESSRARTLFRTGLDDILSAPDHRRTATLALALRLAIRLGERDGMAPIEDALRPRSGGFVLLGYGGPCLGPVDWYLGDAASLRGDEVEGLALAMSSIESCRAAGARAWIDALRGRL